MHLYGWQSHHQPKHSPFDIVLQIGLRHPNCDTTEACRIHVWPHFQHAFHIWSCLLMVYSHLFPDIWLSCRSWVRSMANSWLHRATSAGSFAWWASRLCRPIWQYGKTVCLTDLFRLPYNRPYRNQYCRLEDHNSRQLCPDCCFQFQIASGFALCSQCLETFGKTKNKK